MIRLVLSVLFLASVAQPLSIDDRKINFRAALFPQSREPSIELPLEEDTRIGNVTQRVDHFNPQNTETFVQRYVVYDEFYQSGGPIILLINGQTSLSPFVVDDTLAVDIANETSGMLFALEHRYFGSSYPVANLSTSNLRYLTVDQALADIAHFIVYARATRPALAGSPVLLAGSGYAGSLAVWFRQQYPHLAQAAWASSAPVYAKPNHYEFKENAGALLREIAGSECYERVEQGFAGLEQMARDKHMDELNRVLNVCEEQPVMDRNDVAVLFLTLSELFSTIATIRPYVPSVCAALLDSSHATPVDALVAVFAEFNGPYCLPIDYDEFIGFEQQIELDSMAAMWGTRATAYQRCTQLGWWQTSDSTAQPFGSLYPLAFFEEICQRLFGVDGVKTLAGARRLNVEHGGMRPVVRNVLFTNGADDAGRLLSVLEDLNEQATVVTIPEAGVSFDFYTLQYFGGSAELKQIKLDIVAWVKRWLEVFRDN